MIIIIAQHNGGKKLYYTNIEMTANYIGIDGKICNSINSYDDKWIGWSKTVREAIMIVKETFNVSKINNNHYSKVRFNVISLKKGKTCSLPV